MLPKMQRSHFVKKYSVQFVNASGKLSAPFYFWDNKPHECSQTWQVVRSEFDQMMLDNAREHGVDGARRRARARRAVRGRSRRRRHASRTSDGARREVRAKVVVDASGQAGAAAEPVQAARLGSDAEQGRDLDLLGRRLSRHRPRRRRDDGASRPANRNGWFWYIPLHDDIVSVGVVAPFDYLFKGRGSHEQTYDEEVERCPAVKERVAERDARRPATSRRKDYSYRSTQVAGDGWVLVGDAFGFLDPLYSSGVLLALQVRRAGRRRDRRGTGKGDTSAPRSSASGAPAFNEGVDRMRRLVCEYYDGFSFGAFVRQYPELRGTVTDLLIGDLFTDRVDRVWPAMESLRDGSRPPIPAGSAGTSAEIDLARAPQLTLPDGHRP